MPEYIRGRVVRDDPEHCLNDQQFEHLVCTLFVKGGTAENPDWKNIKTPPDSDYSSSINIFHRTAVLYNSLLKLIDKTGKNAKTADEEYWIARGTLQAIIGTTYQCKNPEKEKLLKEFSKDFPLARFQQFYFDTLQLKRGLVEAYRIEHGLVGKYFHSLPTPPSAGLMVDPAATDASWQKKQRAEITQKEAAILAGVQTRTIHNWEKGEGTPPGYPGRQSRASFMAFIERRESDKRFKAGAQAINNARPAGDMNEFSEDIEY